MTSLIDRAKAVIDECRLLATMTEEPGRTTRRFLTPPMAQVHAHLRARMEALGMPATIDAAGNLWGVLQGAGPHPRRIVLGSHIDTVPNAGAFDGVLGVVLALELVREARDISLPCAIEVIAFSEEEGVRFGVPYLGSLAVAGRFDPALLKLTDSEGVTLESAICAYGLNPNEICNAQIANDAICFLELHIEQGPVLEAEDLQVAAVTAIVGQTRCEVRFLGQANHAGTNPMGLRRDALVAAAEWITAVEAAGRKIDTLVATVGKVVVEPNAVNVIPGQVRVSLDLRHALDSVRNKAAAELLALARAIAARRGLRCEVYRLMEQVAVPMNDPLTGLLAESIEAAGFPPRRMSSGAGHDAMVIATRLPTAMLFLRSPSGLSHHPDEAVRAEEVAAAIQVGAIFLERLSARAV